MAPQRPEDSETQLARIGHRLARLYQIMQENRRRVDEERQELQTLVSDISHQVKTPVSNLKMATDTLLEKPMTEAERTDFIRGIRSQTDKLDFLFQALVKTSRLETGVIQLDKKPGRLFDTVAQAMSGIVYAAEKKEIAVSVDCPEDLTVFHDSKWTSEALFNLLDNAVKYTPAGGKIAVSVVLWELYVEIKVADTGKGISESNQAAIFRRFYREEEVHEQQGVGIGLYLAREIVTRQGGYIKVVSSRARVRNFPLCCRLNKSTLITGENTMKKINFCKATTIILIINVILSIVLFFVVPDNIAIQWVGTTPSNAVDSYYIFLVPILSVLFAFAGKPIFTMFLFRLWNRTNEHLVTYLNLCLQVVFLTCRNLYRIYITYVILMLPLV